MYSKTGIIVTNKIKGNFLETKKILNCALFFILEGVTGNSCTRSSKGGGYPFIRCNYAFVIPGAISQSL